MSSDPRNHSIIAVRFGGLEVAIGVPEIDGEGKGLGELKVKTETSDFSKKPRGSVHYHYSPLLIYMVQQRTRYGKNFSHEEENELSVRRQRKTGETVRVVGDENSLRN